VGCQSLPDQEVGLAWWPDVLRHYDKPTETRTQVRLGQVYRDRLLEERMARVYAKRIVALGMGRVRGEVMENEEIGRLVLSHLQ